MDCLNWAGITLYQRRSVWTTKTLVIRSCAADLKLNNRFQQNSQIMPNVNIDSIDCDSDIFSDEAKVRLGSLLMSSALALRIRPLFFKPYAWPIEKPHEWLYRCLQRKR